MKAQGGLTVGRGATPDSAWTLSHALSGGGGILTGGDTVWLLGGTYTGTFSATLTNSSGTPIVFRQQRGETAKLVQNGGFGQSTTPSLTVQPQATWIEFWDFEITNTSTTQRSDSGGSSHEWVPHAIWNKASHTKFVNLILHDVGHAFLNDPTASDVMISGCIIYNNGWQRPNPPGDLAEIDGHGLYLRNNSTTEYVVASDNIIFNQFGYGIHVYTNATEGLLNRIRLSGNVLFNNGSMTRFGTNANLGNLGEPVAQNQIIEFNRLFFSTQTALNAAPNDGQQLAVGRNLAYGTSSPGTSTRNANYAIGGNPIVEPGSGWTTQGSDITSAVPFEEKVFPARVTAADNKRANIVVFTPSLKATIQADVTGFLVAGDQYTVRNAQQFSTIIKSDTYSGTGTISFSNAGVAAQGSVGTPTLRWPVTTGPLFNVFVVARTPAPPLVATTFTAPSFMNSGQTCNLYASSTGGVSPITYTWSFVGSAVVGYSPQNGVFLAAAQGSSGYSDITVTARDAVGSEKEATKRITIDNWTTYFCN